MKQRWRSVRDRIQKFITSCSKSGSSPQKKHFPLFEEMQFLLTSRTLRRALKGTFVLLGLKKMKRQQEHPLLHLVPHVLQLLEHPLLLLAHLLLQLLLQLFQQKQM